MNDPDIASNHFNHKTVLRLDYIIIKYMANKRHIMNSVDGLEEFDSEQVEIETMGDLAKMRISGVRKEQEVKKEYADFKLVKKNKKGEFVFRTEGGFPPSWR